MKHFVLLFLFLSLPSFAQVSVSGIVRDAATNRAIAFATVADANHSTLTDVDGRFTIQTSTDGTLEISYIGYGKAQILLNGAKYIKITLHRKTNFDDASVNAAAIIRKAIHSKSINDPLKSKQAFRLKSYNKLIVSAEPDSVDATIDTLHVRKKGAIIIKSDSSSHRFKKLIEKQHLFLTEAVSEFQYDGQDLKETITGVKMAGFKQPLYELLALHLQSSSVYDDTYELFETKYNGPLSSNALDAYNYKILDTVIINNRGAYLVYFRATRRNKMAKLQGLLYIDTQNYSVAKAVFRTRGLLNITATHEFEFLPEQQLWFPAGNILKVVKGNNDADIRILGETFKFESNPDNDGTKNKEPSDYGFLLLQSYFF